MGQSDGLPRLYSFRRRWQHFSREVRIISRHCRNVSICRHAARNPPRGHRARSVVFDGRACDDCRVHSACCCFFMQRRFPPRELWLITFTAGFFSVVCFPLFAALAMVTLPARHGGIVQGILPLATAAAATTIAHERPSAGFWWTSAIGAIVVMTFVFRQSGGIEFSSGDLFLIGTVIAGAIGYTLSGRLAMHMPGWEVISWQVIVFLPFSALATSALWPANIAGVPVASWGGLAYAGFISQFAAFGFFNAALAMGGISRIGQIMLLQPFVILALALFVNSEPIDLESILFAAAVVATVLIGQRMRVIQR